jgi:hypothetical protein
MAMANDGSGSERGRTERAARAALKSAPRRQGDDDRSGQSIDTPIGHLDRFGLVLGLLVVTIVVLFLAEGSAVARLLAVALEGSVLVFALDASGFARRWNIAGRALAVATFGFLLFAEVSGQELTTVRVLTAGLVTSVTIIAPVAIARRLIRQPVIDFSSVAAALSIYLLVGLAFTNLYAGLQAIAPPLFSQADLVPDYTDFLYFSFVTLATLGYGDLTPATDFGRLASVIETVLGQVYLVTIVAVIVSNIGQRRPGRARHRHAGGRRRGLLGFVASGADEPDAEDPAAESAAGSDR